MKNDLKTIIDHFGCITQKAKLQEECLELIMAVNHGNHTEVIDEVADVLIMIEQMKIIFKINPSDILKRKEYKIKRTLERIESDFYKNTNHTNAKGSDI